MAKKVVVLQGGFSAEREVSLSSGGMIAQALQKKGYEVILHDLRDVRAFLRLLEAEKPDAVFNGLYGNWGEDGEIQAVLDMLQIPYTHSGVRASLLGMDKNLTRMIAEANGIKVAPAEKMTFGHLKNSGVKMPTPYVVKPVADGSSVGVFIIHNGEELKQIKYDCDDREILVEKFIPGRELTCAVLNGKALAVTELRPKAGFYDYQAKYTGGMTEHILPADLPQAAAEAVKRYAETIHKALGCNMLSRSDFRYNEDDGVVFLEINTNPGMTPLSLVPEQAKYSGISYEELCSRLVEAAQCRKLRITGN